MPRTGEADGEIGAWWLRNTELVLGVMKIFQNWLWWWMCNSVNILKNTELYILSGWITWNVNYASMKLFKKAPKYIENLWESSTAWYPTLEFSSLLAIPCGISGWQTSLSCFFPLRDLERPNTSVSQTHDAILLFSLGDSCFTNGGIIVRIKGFRAHRWAMRTFCRSNHIRICVILYHWWRKTRLKIPFLKPRVIYMT